MFLRSTLMLTKLPRLTHNVLRTCTHQITSQPTQPTKPSSDWNTIYKFPSITFLAKLSKLKIYQSVLTVIGVPVILGLENFQLVSIETTQLFVVLGITGTVSLSLYSLCASNVIGFIYVNPVLRKIRFAYIDFWGRRKDLDITLNELVSSDHKRAFNTYKVVKTTTAAGSLKLLKYGQVLDEGRFFKLFGDL